MIVGEARIENGLRVYAIGDIHGCLRELEHLLTLIDEDIDRHPTARHQLIFLGDYVDRGPAVRQVLELLITLDKSCRDTVVLKGNHEDWLLGFLNQPELAGTSYLRWGGIQTLASYGVLQEPGTSLETLAGLARKAIPESHTAFMKRLPLFHICGDYCFVHAGLRPGIALEDQMEHDLMWIRQDFLTHTQPFTKVIIHGHTPIDVPEICNNRINIDTTCFDSGVLTALVLEGTNQRFLDTRS